MSGSKNRLSERTLAAVREAYRRFGGLTPSANPIFTDETWELLQEQDPSKGDPWCLFHYVGALGRDHRIHGRYRSLRLADMEVSP